MIVSHAASYALVDRDNVLRVLVTASHRHHVRRLAEANGVDEKQATKSIDAEDAGRADYLKRFYGVSAELPTHYDLVLNTDRIPADKLSDVVVNATSLSARQRRALPSRGLKQFDEVPRGIADQHLHAAGTSDDVVAERHTLGAQPSDLALEFVDDEMDAIPTARPRLRAVGHGSGRPNSSVHSRADADCPA